VALDPKHRPQRWDAPSSTVRRDWRKYPQEAYVLNEDGRRYRRLTVDEIALIQGIDPATVHMADLSDRRRIAALGDAVPPPVACAIAGAINESWSWENTTAVEFCAGIGGLAEGPASIGLEHLALVDHSDDCGALLRHQRPWDPSSVHVADVRTFPFRRLEGRVGLLSGGPPCQPWSQAGHGRGADDERDLLAEVPRVVSEVSPEAFVIENVPGLASEQNLPYLRDVMQQLRNPGGRHRYGVLAATLNAADFGVPQARRRLFIIGLRDAPAAAVYRVFDRVASRATHRDPRLPSDGSPPWVTVGDVLSGREDPGGWRRWIGF
jgi:site-specific DNA-cytosine methylase